METTSLPNGIQSKMYCSFRLAGRLFGINIIDIKEITRETICTPIPHSPEQVAGYLNLRGQIHLILDLRLLLGLEKSEINSNSRIVLFKQTISEPLGVLVDNIGDVIEATGEEIEERRMRKEHHEGNDKRILNSDLSSGILKLNKELLVVLDSNKIVKAIN